MTPIPGRLESLMQRIVWRVIYAIARILPSKLKLACLYHAWSDATAEEFEVVWFKDIPIQRVIDRVFPDEE